MRATLSWFAIACTVTAIGCADDSGPSEEELRRRAYVVSRDAPELTVIDLETLEIIAKVPIGSQKAHMAEVSQDADKVYVSSSDSDEIIVVDASTLTVTKRFHAGAHSTHMITKATGHLLAIMNEDSNSVSFVDTRTDTEIKEVEGFAIPHFLRFSPDGRTGYVANIGAHHVSVVDLEQLAIVDNIVLDGFQGPPDWTPAGDETGFADAQIAPDGLMYAAHARTGRVLVYDTINKTKVSELAVGTAPWVAFAEHPFQGVALKHLVTNFGDATVSLINGSTRSVMATLPGDAESYGVNVTPLAPDRAYVMNKVRGDIAVVDTASGTVVDHIAVGGNTETAATSADGKYVVAAVSGANSIVILDAATGTVAKTIEGIAAYPWSVTIPGGQNYCH